MGREENNSTLGAQTARPTMSLDENNSNRITVHARAEGVTVRAHVDNTASGSRQRILAGARASASEASALAGASRDANLAETASEAAAQAEKQRATARAMRNRPGALAGGKMTVDSVSPADTANFGSAANPETVKKQQTQMAHSRTKLSKGIIGGLVAFVVLAIVTAGCLGWFFGVYDQPEYVVADAFTKLISAERVYFAGTAEFEKTKETGGADAGSITMDSGFDFALLTGRDEGVGLDLKLELSNSDSDAVYSLSTSAFLPKAGRLYASLTGTSDFANTYLNEIYNDDESILSLEEAIETFPVLQDVVDLATELDDTWLELAPDDETDEAKKLEFASCVLDSLRKESVARKISALYDKYGFVTVTEATGVSEEGLFTKAYRIKIDANNFVGFVNELYTDIAYPNANTCLNTSRIADDILIEPSDGVVVEVADVEEAIAHLESMAFVINGWNHRLTKVYYYRDADAFEGVLSMTVNYPSAIAFPEVNETSPFSTFTEFLQKLFNPELTIDEDIYVEYEEAEETGEDAIDVEMSVEETE